MEAIHPLKTYRAKAELTQQQLADGVGVDRETVARWEGGIRRIGRKSLSKVSEFTGIPARELRPDLAELMGDAA